MTIRVYVAAPLDRVTKAKNIAVRLASAGYTVVSRWHEIASQGDRDPLELDERRGLLLGNFEDLESAGLLVAYVAGGTPKCTWSEIGYALALKKPVVLGTAPGADGRNMVDAHPLVTTFTSEELLEETVAAVVAGVAR
jgi:nucleoside 2-deoxyribosyltransferase